MYLLLDEPSFTLQTTLVMEVGFNEAFLLQHLHYRSLISKNKRDGYTWVYKTYEDWKEEIPFWSLNKIRRTIYSLESQGYLLSNSSYNKMKIDRTKWYRIDYTKPIFQTQNGTVGVSD
ncbi:hypothetical protein [Sporosarcina ureae]|uniref:hypothetical protein n=1 Tax=Sporosarcina ureae TaxID=1571 RepID=UPI0026F18180|nr:hypothetical protein [Sporosarcina ureae]